jgi:biopolymer transport protein TolR
VESTSTPFGQRQTVSAQWGITMAMSIAENKGAIAEMNVVPLIDILLVLLIIFMMITPLTPKGLETLLPRPNSDTVDPKTDALTVVVQVTQGGKIKINNENTDVDRLGPRMEQIFKDRAEKVAFVKGDNDVVFMDVARAIDILRGSGIDKIGLITGLN